jgi:hypothetical protein
MESMLQEQAKTAGEQLPSGVRDRSIRAARVIVCSRTPGHGVDFDERAAARFPYEPRQLPVARLEDGTMWNW